MKKIIVKDYYALKRAKARNEKLSKERKKEIAKQAVTIRWNKYEQLKKI